MSNISMNISQKEEENVSSGGQSGISSGRSGQSQNGQSQSQSGQSQNGGLDTTQGQETQVTTQGQTTLGQGQEESNFMRDFMIGIHHYPTVYSQLSPLAKYILILRVVFTTIQILWSVCLLSLYATTPSLAAYSAMFSIWTVFAVSSLFAPLYYAINQNPLGDPILVQRERRKRFLYSWIDMLFLLPFILNGVLIFNGPSQATEYPIYYYSSMLWLILNFSYTFFPAVLACVAVLCLPCIFILIRNAQAREEARVRALGATDDLINSIPILRFRKKVASVNMTTDIEQQEPAPISPFELSSFSNAFSSSSSATTTTGASASAGAGGDYSPSKPALSIVSKPHASATVTPEQQTNSTESLLDPSSTSSFPSPSSSLPTATTAASTKPKKPFRLFPLLSKPKPKTQSPTPSSPPTISIATDDALCSICLVEYVENEPLRQLGCSHHYHVACIDEWLKVNAMCPQCRTRELLVTGSPSRASPAANTAN